jgi:hypothetical protein
MIEERKQAGGRTIMLPVYVSDHITDEMIELFLETGKSLTVNAGRISEQVVLPYLETHFGCSGKVVDADGYDHLFDNGVRNEHKKLVCTAGKTSATAKRLGANKQGKCDTISFHHPVQNAIYVIDSVLFYEHAIHITDKSNNSNDVIFYQDMQLVGKGKRTKSTTWHNTKVLLDHSTKIQLQ